MIMLMIICRNFKLFVLKAVQNNELPAGKACGVFLLFTILLVSGCNNWPEPAERVLAIEKRQKEIPARVDREYINDLVNITESRLAMLESSGAKYCLPGQIYKAKKHMLRARHEVDGNLYLDAQYTLVKVMNQLDYTAELMMGLAEGSECLGAYEFSAKNEHKDKVERYIESISNLLNCQCDQVSDDEMLVENFNRRLEVAAQALSTHEQLSIIIHATKHSEQVNEMKLFFSNHGARNEQLSVHYDGDKEHALSKDGLWFEIVVKKPKRNHKLKNWDENLRVMSVKQEERDEP